MEKQKRKEEEARALQLQEDEELRDIARKNYRQYHAARSTGRRFDIIKKLPMEGQKIQRVAVDNILGGRQLCLDKDALQGKQWKDKTTMADRMWLQRERLFQSNFYAVDVETNGFRHNEPIQIAAVLYENGLET